MTKPLETNGLKFMKPPTSPAKDSFPFGEKAIVVTYGYPLNVLIFLPVLILHNSKVSFSEENTPPAPDNANLLFGEKATVLIDFEFPLKVLISFPVEISHNFKVLS